MIARMVKWFAAIGLVFVLLSLATVYGAYYRGLAAIGPGFAPTTRSYSTPVRLALWRDAGGTGEPCFGSEGPLRFAVNLWRRIDAGASAPASPDLRIRGQLARRMSVDAGKNFRLAEIAMVIEMGQQWRSDQILDTALDRMYFGEHATGAVEGAQLYFGQAPDALTPQQLHVLLALAWSWSYLDPWCHPDRLQAHLSSHAFTQMTPADAAATLQTLAPRPADHACR
jgi:hypothetical protein